jgi:hypothetical protein
VLDPDAIQGDILLGLQKLLERFVFFEIGDVPAFQLTLRGDLAGRIITTATSSHASSARAA